MTAQTSLGDLLHQVDGVVLAAGSDSLAVSGLAEDSRQVSPGDVFVAIVGTGHDGRTFIDQAIENGAAAIVTDDPHLPVRPGAAAWVHVANARRALAAMASAFYGAAEALTLTGITGTNGKTTLTYLLESVLTSVGRRTGLLGTVNYRFESRTWPAPNTTPGALLLQRLLSEMRAAGARDVVMEVTSIALEQDRVFGCPFRVAGLTNLTQDHLDYHGTMEAYFDAKVRLFSEHMHVDGVSVLFSDRPEGEALKRHVRGRRLMVATTPDATADVRVVDRDLRESGTQIRWDSPVGPIAVHSPLVGSFNVSNLTLAAGMAVAHGLSATEIEHGLSQSPGVPGRLERIENAAGVLCVVDYAHTPDALERALEVMRPLTRGRLWVVFGCGGDRDSGKRAIMGEAAGRLADLAIVTSDNPRTEDPDAIVAMVSDGVRQTSLPELSLSALQRVDRGFAVETDRRAAIGAAVAGCQRGDSLIIAGKGHEDYQILGTTKVYFDDRKEAAAAFAHRDATSTEGP